jgi:dihydrofolate synthase / folylpolyglutamate synthase
VPHIIGILPPDATRVMERTCRARKAPLVRVTPRIAQRDDTKLRLDFEQGDLNLSRLRPALPGTHQLKNAAVALLTISTLRDRGVKISRTAITKGLRSTYWPGRFQIIKAPKKPMLILDVCHNAAGARAFADTFQKLFPRRKALVLFGAVKKKEHQAMFDFFAPLTKEYMLIPLKTHRSMPPRELLATINFHGVPTNRAPDLPKAYNRLLRQADPDDIIVVAGSHYLVGEFLQKYT